MGKSTKIALGNHYLLSKIASYTGNLIILMRPSHWIKNLFLFLPLFFAGDFFHWELLAGIFPGVLAIFIVSASMENWIEPWCMMNNMGCIATRLEVKSGKLTGKLSGKNCNGMEKVNRILETIDLNQYEEIYAYGDSRGDLPMLQLAKRNKRYYRTFI